ncbi:MAG: phage shock protein operon transcriptional activator [Haliea sp.]|jgi:psp operon transcriptional activator|nr:phage shock protein operon transcriptional activator [Haliea sp.]
MRQPESIIGNSAALTDALEQVSQLAQINRPILVLGERGTGKELAAERLHYLSPRWDAPLLKVNCAAMAESLLDSELFGHEPGAFTGATRVHQGRFERADGGTLFLDELGTMSLRLQEKLLRLVEYGEFERLGGQQTRRVDVRVVAATNVDLRIEGEAGKFRQDLLDRLSFDVVHLPPLRYRREDIVELAQHFAVQMSAELGWDIFPGFTDSAVQSLEKYAWPGNVRELKNTVERSLFRWNDQNAPIDLIVTDPFASPFEETGLSDDLSTTEDTQEPQRITGFNEHMQQLEKSLLLRALEQHAHNQRRTAETLGLSYDQLRGLVRKHGITSRKRRA